MREYEKRPIGERPQMVAVMRPTREALEVVDAFRLLEAEYRQIAQLGRYWMSGTIDASELAGLEGDWELVVQVRVQRRGLAEKDGLCPKDDQAPAGGPG